MIVGDFNYNLLVHDKNTTVSAFLHMIFENNFQACILGPTRIIDGNNPSLLDNIFSNSIENTISGNLFDKISDHMPNFVIIENVKTSAKKKPIKRRDLKNFDKNKFQADLIHSILPEIEDVVNAEDAYILFHEKYLSILDAHAPFKLLNQKEQELERKPWITKGILTSIRIKAKLYKSFKNSKNSDIYAKFKCYRDLINTLIRKSKKQYYKIYFTENKCNTKNAWTSINSILNRRGKKKCSDIFLNINGSMLTDQKLVANKFNNYFVNVAGKLAKDIPNHNSKYKDFLKNPNPKSFSMKLHNRKWKTLSTLSELTKPAIYMEFQQNLSKWVVLPLQKSLLYYLINP